MTENKWGMTDVCCKPDFYEKYSVFFYEWSHNYSLTYNI